MEELRTTEVLDREILEDARKKAHRILKTADDTLEIQKRDWEKKISGAVNSIRNAYAERTKKIDDETFARLPLDKRRLRSETVEGFLVKAMEDFLRSLKRETLLSILKNELSQLIKTGVEKGEIHQALVRYSGMTLSEAGELLKEISFSEEWKLEEDHSEILEEISEDKKLYAIHEFPSIVVDTETFRINVSVESSAGALMKEKRAELAAALLGEGVLND